MLQGEFSGGELLSVAAVMRVAKNPMKLGHIAAPEKFEAESATSETHKWVAPDGP